MPVRSRMAKALSMISATRRGQGAETGCLAGRAHAPGSILHLDIVDGTVFRETLLELSDMEQFYTYDIIDSPPPVRNYVSTHRFIPVTYTGQILNIWASRFDFAPRAGGRDGGDCRRSDLYRRHDQAE